MGVHHSPPRTRPPFLSSRTSQSPSSSLRHILHPPLQHLPHRTSRTPRIPRLLPTLLGSSVHRITALVQRFDGGGAFRLLVIVLGEAGLNGTGCGSHHGRHGISSACLIQTERGGGHTLLLTVLRCNHPALAMRCSTKKPQLFYKGLSHVLRRIAGNPGALSFLINPL